MDDHDGGGVMPGVPESKRESPSSARASYDLFAEHYDDWPWQIFWRKNEWPHVRALVASCDRRGSLLDVGTGTGFYLGELRSCVGCGCGVDVSYGMLRKARQRIGQEALLIQADATSLPLKAALFDIVLLNRVASHIEDLDALGSELERVLSDRGRLIVSDVAPEHDYCHTELGSKHGRIFVETYKHTMESWLRFGRRHGLAVIFQRTISARNVDWLPADGFSSIDRSGVRPVGFILAFERA